MSDKYLYVRPEIYDVIKARAFDNHRPMSSQVELDIKNLIKIEPNQS